MVGNHIISSVWQTATRFTNGSLLPPGDVFMPNKGRSGSKCKNAAYNKAVNVLITVVGLLESGRGQDTVLETQTYFS